MTTEEKAKAYDEALERARNLHKDALNMDENILAKQCEIIFPEIKESEDERIRKAIICGMNALKEQNKKTFASIPINDCVAWLKKQGEQKSIDKSNTVDKLKPKFKVNDWITDGYVGGKITSIDDNYPCYKIADFMGCIDSPIPFTVQDNYHLWTIDDAKDGDVLVASDGSIFLFAGVVDCACKYYVALATDNYVKINKNAKGGYWETSKSVYPATKKQCDSLFQKLKEASYVWDANKKELKKLLSL